MSAHARFIGAVKDDWQLYSDAPEDYTLGGPYWIRCIFHRLRCTFPSSVAAQTNAMRAESARLGLVAPTLPRTPAARDAAHEPE